MATYVGKWDCPACGTKRIPGWANGRTVERCPACGHPGTGKWYMDDRSMVLADPAEIAAAQGKRAWVCGHCAHINDGADVVCDSCGNARDDASEDGRIVAREFAPGEAPAREAETLDPTFQSVEGQAWDPVRSVRQETEAERRIREAREAAERKRKRKLLYIFGGIVAGIVLLVWMFSLSKEVDFKVSGFSWEREVRIQKFGPQDYSSWDYPPSGAYGVSSAEEVHHYDQIFEGRECHTESRSYTCGTIDNGNGTFSDKYCTENVEVCNDKYRDEPVYATRYYFTIDEWAYSHTVAEKAQDHAPVWPIEPKVDSNPGVWREGARTGRYYLFVELKDGKPHQDEVTEARWQKTEKGDVVRGFVHPWFGYFKGLKKS